MKKWITAIATAAMLIMALAGCASEKESGQLGIPDSGKGVAQQAQTPPTESEAQKLGTQTPAPPQERLTVQKAKEIALNHAGVSNPTDLKVELDWENGKEVYEVDFESGTTDYDYTVDAYSGEILKAEKETEKKPASTAAPKPTTAPERKRISKEEAKKIALNHAGVSNPRELEVELDWENGKEVYEVSFESGKTEYDYDIDAYSGKILKAEKEIDD